MVTNHINTLTDNNRKNNFTKAIITMCTLTSQLCLETYKCLVSVSSQNLNVLSQSRLVLSRVSNLCPSLCIDDNHRS